MPSRKERIAVVLDTNVIVGYYLSRAPQSANARVFRLWRDQRKLQLVVSNEIVAEYVEVLLRLQEGERRHSALSGTVATRGEQFLCRLQ